jgi:dihydroorotase-like cyclic amidohydrolase
MDADLCVFDPRIDWRFDAATSLSVADWSPFDAAPFTGRVIATYLRGQSVYAHGKVQVGAGHGRWLKAAHERATAAVTA